MPTLGNLVIDFVEAFCAIPDGNNVGQPFVLTDEQTRFLLWHYRIHPDALVDRAKPSAPFVFARGSQLVRPQKWGKGPLSAAMICAEAGGPVLFDGWDANGEPVGRPWATPWIQVTAVSEDQTDNVWRALVPMIELGSLTADIPDTGQTRINLPGGGRIEPVTSSGRSRLGQRITFAVQDEALALDTPIPTTRGWTTIGEVEVGASVFGRDGCPTVVSKVTPIQVGRECFTVTMADGSTITTSGGHLWLTRVSGSAAKPSIRTTGEMFADGRRFRIPAPSAHVTPPVDLPVDPYFLGYWLGDGSTGQSYITAGDQDVDEVRELLSQAGVATVVTSPKDRAWRIGFSNASGFQASGRPLVARALQGMECYRSKHIPAAFFGGSIDQRTALLQGLMDSDGHVTENGHCTFVGNDQLSADLLRLIRSLGQVARRTWSPDQRSRFGGVYKVNFCPRGDLQPFRLTRKAERVRPSRRGPEWVTVTSIAPTDSVPVRCIEVASPDRLFLAGEGGHVTHNTHSWLERNGGWKLADNQRRNLSGMSGRFVETTNAWDPTEDSVAQRTSKAPIGVHVDFPPPPAGSVRNRRDRRRVMRHVYGDSHWVDLDRIDLEVEALLEHDPAQAERYFLNRIHAGESVAFDAAKWAAGSRPGAAVPAGELIVIGVDGARFDDALGIVATDVVTGFQWPLAIIERPPNAPDGYEHDLSVANQALVDAFARYDVWRVYIDPEKIEHLVDIWQGRWGEQRVVKWYMSRLRQTAWSVRNYRAAIGAGDLTHDGDETLTRHVGNARRMPTNVKDDDGRPLFSIQKDRPGSPNKIDGAAAAVISWEARGDAIAVGAKKKHRGPAVFV